jgi:hypothetical protein
VYMGKRVCVRVRALECGCRKYPKMPLRTALKTA